MSQRPEAFIGIWDGHDAGAALVIEGKVELALNEERLSGRKLDVGFPSRALSKIRDAAKNLEVKYAITTSDPAKTLTRTFPSMKESYYRLRRRLVPPRHFNGLTLRVKYSLTQARTNDFLRIWTKRSTARRLGVPARDVIVVDHHAAHAASAAFWPAWDGDATIVTLDGIGDGQSGSVWVLRRSLAKLEPVLSIPGAHSLGLFFEHVTQELQMRPLEDEGKVMALATYAAEFPPEKNVFLKWFKLETGADKLPVLKCSIPASKMARRVADVVWCTPREQVCKMAQQALEILVPAFFDMLVKAGLPRNFAYAGGVASNIKVNRLIRNIPGIADLKVCPAMGDGGLPLGAALFAYQLYTHRLPQPFNDFRLGSKHADIGESAEKFIDPAQAIITRPENIAEAVAEKVAAGKVVMWAQGRMELGARALGARSIVARADSTAARDDLNLRLKKRVWFQPFCPSMLLSEASRLLEDYRGEVDANFHMTMGFLTTPLGRSLLAGAVGPDGSCRPQMVDDSSQEPWANLLRAMKTRTGTGAVINTSLNMHGKPMSDGPEGVIDAWMESGVEYLALGSAFITKRIS